MEVFDLMSGAQGEEAHQEYKEEDGSHCGDDWILFCVWFVMTCFSLQLFSRDWSVV